MDSRKQRKILLVNMVLAAFIISAGFFVFELATGATYSGAGKGIELFGSVYTKIINSYVKEVDPWKTAKDGIEGMLDNLDPYSTFFDDTDYKQMQEDSRGEFAGLGIMIGTLNDYPTVMESPMEGWPAMRAGLRAGDVIIEIEGESTYKMAINIVVSKLRGQVDTFVNFKVRRGISDEPLKFTIKREIIHLENIAYNGEIEPGIGYVKLNWFTAEASDEMSTALTKLQLNPNLKGVILDLRYNPGGLLTAARDIANAFLPKNSAIVSTRGRTTGETQRLIAEDMPLMPKMPLVVLVNKGSASASEIVAGAIQDHDRGVLLGETTYGKGSVQTLLDLPGGSGLKLTTALYYTPSGRCIHRERTREDEMVAFSREEEELRGKSSNAEDSTKAAGKFYTLAKERVVYEGGGITPDIIVKEKMVGNIVSQLVYQSVFFDFAVLYTEKHPDLQADFEVTDDLVNEFKQFIGNSKKFDYSIPGKTNLERFRSAIEKEKYDTDVLNMIDKVQKTLVDRRNDDFNANIDVIKRILKREIASTKFGSSAKTIASKDWDVQLQKAIEILKNPDKYNAILSKGAKTGVEED